MARRYNHLFSVAFSVEVAQENPEDVLVADLLVGMRRRYDDLMGNLPEAGEAFENLGDSYEIPLRRFRCDNCGEVHEESHLKLARDVLSRIDVGGTFTPYECPDCGALAYLIKEA